MALEGLVGRPADRLGTIMAEQQRADATMGDEGDVAAGMGREDRRDGRRHPDLGIGRALPAAHAFVGGREELVGDALELRRRQEACGAAVVLVKSLVDADRQPGAASQDAGRFDRLGLVARPDRRQVLALRRGGEEPHAPDAAVRQMPARHRHAGIDHHLRMRDEKSGALADLPDVTR